MEPQASPFSAMAVDMHDLTSLGAAMEMLGPGTVYKARPSSVDGPLHLHQPSEMQAHTAVHTAAAIARSCEPLPAQGYPTRQRQGGDQSAVQSMIMLPQHGLHARSRSWGTALTMTSVSMPSGHLAFAVQHESTRAMTSLMMQHEPHQTAGQHAVAEARHPHGTSTRGMQLPAQLDRAGRAQPMSSGPRLALQPWGPDDPTKQLLSPAAAAAGAGLSLPSRTHPTSATPYPSAAPHSSLPPWYHAPCLSAISAAGSAPTALTAPYDIGLDTMSAMAATRAPFKSTSTSGDEHAAGSAAAVHLHASESMRLAVALRKSHSALDLSGWRGLQARQVQIQAQMQAQLMSLRHASSCSCSRQRDSPQHTQPAQYASGLHEGLGDAELVSYMQQPQMAHQYRHSTDIHLQQGAAAEAPVHLSIASQLTHLPGCTAAAAPAPAALSMQTIPLLQLAGTKHACALSVPQPAVPIGAIAWRAHIQAGQAEALQHFPVPASANALAYHAQKWSSISPTAAADTEAPDSKEANMQLGDGNAWVNECLPGDADKPQRLSFPERRASIARYRAKRERRNFAPGVQYQCRKVLADSRPRVGGRFAKMGDPYSVPPHMSKKQQRQLRAQTQQQQQQQQGQVSKLPPQLHKQQQRSLNQRASQAKQELLHGRRLCQQQQLTMDKMLPLQPSVQGPPPQGMAQDQEPPAEMLPLAPVECAAVQPMGVTSTAFPLEAWMPSTVYAVRHTHVSGDATHDAAWPAQLQQPGDSISAAAAAAATAAGCTPITCTNPPGYPQKSMASAAAEQQALAVALLTSPQLMAVEAPQATNTDTASGIASAAVCATSGSLLPAVYTQACTAAGRLPANMTHGSVTTATTSAADAGSAAAAAAVYVMGGMLHTGQAAGHVPVPPAVVPVAPAESDGVERLDSGLVDALLEQMVAP